MSESRPGPSTRRPSPSGRSRRYGNTPPKYIKVDLGKAADDKAKNNDIWKSKLRSDFK